MAGWGLRPLILLWRREGGRGVGDGTAMGQGRTWQHRLALRAGHLGCVVLGTTRPAGGAPPGVVARSFPLPAIGCVEERVAAFPRRSEVRANRQAFKQQFAATIRGRRSKGRDMAAYSAV